MKKMLAILFVMLFLQACTLSAPTAPFQPSQGILLTNYSAPLTINFDKTKQVEIDGLSATKHVSFYIFRFAIGDASLKEAIEEGELKNALYADYTWLNILSIFGRLEVNVYGEKENAVN